jgi:hypothetical protein
MDYTRASKKFADADVKSKETAIWYDIIILSVKFYELLWIKIIINSINYLRP